MEVVFLGALALLVAPVASHVVFVPPSETVLSPVPPDRYLSGACRWS